MPTVFLSAALAWLAGCGPSFPKTYPVKGKVVLKGGGKLANGTHIMFQSASNSKEDGTPVTADGAIEEDGSFTVATKMFGKQREGAVEGEHKVLIIEPQGNAPFPKSQMIIVQKPARVEPRANDLTIEAQKPGGR
jgi:hypothetical protein